MRFGSSNKITRRFSFKKALKKYDLNLGLAVLLIRTLERADVSTRTTTTNSHSQFMRSKVLG